MKKNAFSIGEVIIAIGISSLLFSLTLPTLNIFFKLYKRTNYDNLSSANYRVLNNISTLIGSTSIESNSEFISSSKNLGFKILNTENIYLNNIYSKSIKNLILPFNTKGDSLYIEIPYFKKSNSIILTNQFHLYRFVTVNTQSEEQSLNYISGLKEGSKTMAISFGKEEKVLTKVFNGYFLEVRGGVILEYNLENSQNIKKLFIRSGEL